MSDDDSEVCFPFSFLISFLFSDHHQKKKKNDHDLQEEAPPKIWALVPQLQAIEAQDLEITVPSHRLFDETPLTVTVTQHKSRGEPSFAFLFFSFLFFHDY